MSSVVTVLTVIFSVILTPFLIFFCGIVVLAALGRTLGVRRLYVKLLLRVFEYGRESIEKNLRRRNSESGEEDDTDDVGHHKVHKLTPNGGLVNGRKENGIGKKLTNGYVVANTNTVINREDFILLPEPVENNNVKNGTNEQNEETVPEENGEIDENKSRREFELKDVLDYIKTGVEAIIEDQVTSRFEAEELKSWNLLTRTNRNYEFINWRITVIWVIGFWIRYAFLLPLRVLICFFGVSWALAWTFLLSVWPDSDLKRVVNELASLITFRIFALCISAVINTHNVQWKPRKGGVCVANHTTPADAVILSTETAFSLTGQRHGGFLGILQRALARASPHIWFERDEAKDREAVAERLRLHVSDPNNPPILIFPEGTCMNNTSVMQFKKGSFEVGSVIYPVAIKYDPRFGDAFWNSSKYSMMQYLYLMMTSWAIVCDVWYLPPMTMEPDENAVQFANRVKRAIAERGGLVDLMWDGQLKRMKPKKEWKERHQEEFSKRLKIE
ncbi:glycerol-3-phosphate acyltransferase 3 isoform X2 [Planococcus citri]|uniref:glycerol-3-phosphate acyltransferase 3 isoform X2 n=1 Tax=Planococcus citri TaxID=170843 RepID=UPI0031F7B744